MRSLARAVLPAVALMVLSSCTGTKMVQTWRDPKYEGQPVKRVFVVCVGPTDANRVVLENAIAQALLDRGFLSATATGVFGYDPPDKDKTVAFVRENKVDLVIVQRLMKETDLTYMAATMDTMPVTPSYGTWYSAYGYGGTAYTPAYMAEDTRVKAETTVFSAQSQPEKMVWSSASTTMNVQDAKSGAKSLASTLVKNLVEAGILVK
jgi:hypothetical protein